MDIQNISPENSRKIMYIVAKLVQQVWENIYNDVFGSAATIGFVENVRKPLVMIVDTFKYSTNIVMVNCQSFLYVPEEFFILNDSSKINKTIERICKWTEMFIIKFLVGILTFDYTKVCEEIMLIKYS